jgi:hypothetical protein
MKSLRSISAFYLTRSLTTAFTRGFHLYLSWARPIQSKISDPIPKRPTLILLIHVRFGPLSGQFPPGFPTNNLYTFLFSPIRVTFRAHLIFLDIIILIIPGVVHKSCTSSLCSFVHPLIHLRSKYPPQYPVLKHRQFVLPVMSESMLDTHLEPRAKLYFYIFYSLNFWTVDEKTEW